MSALASVPEIISPPITPALKDQGAPMEFKGIITPVITPFNEDYGMDDAAYAAFLKHNRY